MYNDVKIIIDLDGTICPIKDKGGEYADLIPNRAVVRKMKFYADNGAKIVIFTSRNMRTYRGDVAQITKKTVPVIKEWLKKWGISYDELIVGKPWAGELGFYVDDRAVRPDEFLEYDFEDLMEICRNSSRDGVLQ